jgi:hypothetical protein
MKVVLSSMVMVVNVKHIQEPLANSQSVELSTYSGTWWNRRAASGLQDLKVKKGFVVLGFS